MREKNELNSSSLVSWFLSCSHLFLRVSDRLTEWKVWLPLFCSHFFLRQANKKQTKEHQPTPVHFLIFHRIYHHPSRRPTGFKQSNTQSVQTDKWEAEKTKQVDTKLNLVHSLLSISFLFVLRARFILAVVVKSFYIDRSFSSCLFSLFSPWLLACCKIARARRWTTCPSKPWVEVLDCRALISPRYSERDKWYRSRHSFAKHTSIIYGCAVVASKFLSSIVFQQKSPDSITATLHFPDCLAKKKIEVQEKDFSESFFKRVVVVCRQL